MQISSDLKCHTLWQAPQITPPVRSNWAVRRGAARGEFRPRRVPTSPRIPLLVVHSCFFEPSAARSGVDRRNLHDSRGRLV